jgi:fumarate hydratase class II
VHHHPEGERNSVVDTSPGSETNGADAFRVEHDTMGEVRVPRTALYAAQTQRAVENFPISGRGLEPAQIQALARIKRAAAIVNGEMGIIDADVSEAIVAAADEVAGGSHHGHFPVDVYQTGSGTSSNMNMNEVLAALATASLGKPVHPNDHVNASQSSNDVFPTSVHVAVTGALLAELIPALEHLAEALETKAEAWKGLVKAGRTHLMDATPVTFGQEFAGYARQVRLGIERVRTALPRVAEVPLGGTATGTGINTPLGFPQKVIRVLAEDTGLPVTEALDHFEAQGARDGLVDASGALRTLAVSLTKICNDIRWMGSGPNTGLGELHIPDLQPGSSIMPGKVNPVIPEAVLMVCARVIGRVGGRLGPVRAQRRDPRHGLVAARVDPHPRVLHAPARRQDGRRPARQRGARTGARGVVAVHRHAAEPHHRLRGRGEDREALGRAEDDGARGRRRPRLRRARRDHRGAARPGPRRAADDGARPLGPHGTTQHGRQRAPVPAGTGARRHAGRARITWGRRRAAP